MSSEWFCEYCGEPADTRDHLFPLAWTGQRRHGGRTGPWVPCCRDCNTRLGDFAGHTVDLRRRHVQRKLERKHQDLLRYGWPSMSDWPELGRSLRLFRAKRGLALARVLSRLAWPKRAEWERSPGKVAEVEFWSAYVVH